MDAREGGTLMEGFTAIVRCPRCLHKGEQWSKVKKATCTRCGWIWDWAKPKSSIVRLGRTG